MTGDGTKEISDEELQKLANQFVSEKEIDSMYQDDAYRNFYRILHFMCKNSAVGLVNGQFGYFFSVRDADDPNFLIDINLEIKLSPVRRVAPGNIN